MIPNWPVLYRHCRIARHLSKLRYFLAHWCIGHLASIHWCCTSTSAYSSCMAVMNCHVFGFCLCYGVVLCRHFQIYSLQKNNPSGTLLPSVAATFKWMKETKMLKLKHFSFHLLWNKKMDSFAWAILHYKTERFCPGWFLSWAFSW